jgi:hypothetical protein
MTLFLIIRFIYLTYFRFPHLRVLKATICEWTDRQMEKIVTYQIELEMKRSSDELVLEELWIDNKRYDFRLITKDRRFADSFSRKEKICLDIISEIKDELQKENERIRLKGRLILAYTFRSKRRYLRINKIRHADELQLVA